MQVLKHADTLIQQSRYSFRFNNEHYVTASFNRYLIALSHHFIVYIEHSCAGAFRVPSTIPLHRCARYELMRIN